MESSHLQPSQTRDARNWDLTFPIAPTYPTRKSLIFPCYIDCTVVPILMVFPVGSLNSHDALMTCAAVASKSPAVGPWLMGKAYTGTEKHGKHGKRRKPGCVLHEYS